jgi:hypothetical protein
VFQSAGRLERTQETKREKEKDRRMEGRKEKDGILW